MLLFCKICGNSLSIDHRSGQNYYVCYVCPITCQQKRKITYKTYQVLKNIDDVLGGEEAWKNVNTTSICCPKCAHSLAYFLQLQIRSADEPMTTFYRCANKHCNHNWRDQ